MKNRRWIQTSVILILSGSILYAGESPRVPGMLLRANGDSMWVSAERAQNADRTLNEAALGRFTEFFEHASREAPTREVHEDSATTGNELSAAPPACMSFIEGQASDRTSPDRLIDTASVIVTGRITDVKEGFFFSQPGTLLAIAGQTLKGTLPGPNYLMFYPYAREI
jgi:hypothetical protein